MVALTQLALLFGGIIATGLILTFLHDVFEVRLLERQARQQRQSVIVRAALPRSEGAAPILTVRLKREEPKDGAYPKAA